MINEQTTISYKEKSQQKRQQRIDALLLELPPYCRSYEMFLRASTVIKTRVEYLQDIYTFFRFLKMRNPAIGEIKDISTDILEKLNGFDFDEYNFWLVDYKFDNTDDNENYKHNSEVTRKRKFAALRSFFKFLYVREFMSCNPSEKAVTPKIRKKKRSDIRILEDNECNAFLNIIDRDLDDATLTLEEAKADGKVSKRVAMKPALILRDKAIVYLFLGTGLRVSELCAIDCENISPLGFINVIRKEDSDEARTTDRVYLGDEVQSILYDYISEARSVIGAGADNYDALFLSSKHERMTPRAIEMMIKGYADRALGTNHGITPHKLRATFGTRYYSMTGDISATSTVMNHSSIEVTASYYLQEDKNAKERAAEVKI